MLDLKKLYLFASLAMVGVLLAACAGETPAALVEGGDPYRGAQAIQRQGCHSCHRIPGIRGANSYVGPPLDGWSARQYIAGSLENTPNNLIEWIMNPQSIEPGTAMPDMNIKEEEARDIAAYLYTLEPDRPGPWNQGE